MLIATCGPTTGWVGKAITFENEQFTLQDHGPITAADVLTYYQQGHLLWANDGMRAWVQSKAGTPQAQGAAAPASAPEASAANEVPGTLTSAAAGLSPTSRWAVNLKRLSPRDWVVFAGFLAMSIGNTLAWYAPADWLYHWYTLSGFRSILSHWRTGFLSPAGWDSPYGMYSWLAALLAVLVVCLSAGVIPRLHIKMWRRVPLILKCLGGFALLLVLIGLVVTPHPYGSSDQYMFGAGIVFSLLGAAVIVVGSLFRGREPADVVAPSAAWGTKPPSPAVASAPGPGTVKKAAALAGTASAVVGNAAQSAKVSLTEWRAAAKSQSSSPPGTSMPLVAPLAPAAPRVATSAAPTPPVERRAPAETQVEEAAPPAPLSQPAPSPKPAAAPVDSPATSTADEIAKLAELHDKGFITDAEFVALKAKLMG